MPLSSCQVALTIHQPNSITTPQAPRPASSLPYVLPLKPASFPLQVVLTIHQPNSIITSKFDDFMLLGAGRLVYAGAWHEAVDFFAGCGSVGAGL